MYSYHPNRYPLEFCKRMNDTSLSCPLLVDEERRSLDKREEKGGDKELDVQVWFIGFTSFLY